MAKYESVNLLYNLLKNARYPLTKKQLQEKLECSAASIERYITELRDTYSQNIVYQRDYKGYQLVQNSEEDIELPSHLFTANEINAMLLLEQIINELEPGFLKKDTETLKRHLAQIREKFAGKHKLSENRIRMINIGKRQSKIRYLSGVTQAVLQRKKITIEYDSRSGTTPSSSTRTLSPQRLTHYRDNWYLDAWCHQHQALRTFALERITRLEIENPSDKSPIKNLSARALDDHYAQTFGIFGGKVVNTAVLKFTPHRSQWVAEEIWHHEQRGKWLKDGSYQLEIPYGNDTELLGDILKYGDQVEVIGPKELRTKLIAHIENLQQIYVS